MIENCLKTMQQVLEGFYSSTFSEFSVFPFSARVKKKEWGKISLPKRKTVYFFQPNAEANIFLFLRFSLSYCRICTFAVFNAVLFAVAVAVVHRS